MSTAQWNLKPGDWVNVKYGFDRFDVYIVRVLDGYITWCSPKWCRSSAMTVSFTEFDSYCPAYVGRGKPRRWLGLFDWLPGVTDLSIPYTTPKNR